MDSLKAIEHEKFHERMCIQPPSKEWFPITYINKVLKVVFGVNPNNMARFGISGIDQGNQISLY